MEIRVISIDQINAAAYNPRVDLQPGDPEYEKLKRSIEQFGYIDPIIWNIVLHDVKTENLIFLRCENNYKVNVPPGEQVEGKAQAKAREGNEVPFMTCLWIRAKPHEYTPLRA